MKRQWTTLLATIGLAILPLSGPSQAAQDCTDKVLATCTTCHYQTRICAKLDKNGTQEWQTTIKRMMRYGLTLGEKEQASILECLVALKDDHAKFCK